MPTLPSDPLTAISPLDGRYRGKCEELAPFFSELALMRYRVQVEVHWLLHLAGCPDIEELPAISDDDRSALMDLYQQFDIEDGRRIKEFEASTKQQDAFAKSEYPEGAQLCTRCNNAAVVMMDGCMTCLSCGDSKCG